MNKRQRKKKFYQYVSATGRYGCEECCNVCNRIPINSETDQWWIGVAIKIHKIKNKWRMTLIANNDETGIKESVCYTNISYCPFCGRKLR